MCLEKDCILFVTLSKKKKKKKEEEETREADANLTAWTEPQIIRAHVFLLGKGLQTVCQLDGLIVLFLDRSHTFMLLQEKNQAHSISNWLIFSSTNKKQHPNLDVFVVFSVAEMKMVCHRAPFNGQGFAFVNVHQCFVAIRPHTANAKSIPLAHATQVSRFVHDFQFKRVLFGSACNLQLQNSQKIKLTANKSGALLTLLRSSGEIRRCTWFQIEAYTSAYTLTPLSNGTSNGVPNV